MKLGIGKTSFRGSTAAAGFVAGVAVTLMLFAGHQKHSEAHLEASARSLPGQLSENDSSTGSTAQARGSGSVWAQAAAKRPPPLPPIVPPDLDSASRLMVSFGNSAYFELVQNWAHSVMGLQDTPFLIAAFDEPMLGRCSEHGLPCTRAELGTHSDNFRGDFAAFRRMGALKIRFVLDQLDRHPQLSLVVVSDSDVVWLRQPWNWLSQRPNADFFVSTDCLSVKVEEEWLPAHNQPRCGHVTGNHFGRAFNTGLFAARNTPAAKAFLAAWADMLTDPARERHSDAEQRGIDDQMALNLLFEAGGIEGAGADSPRAIRVWNRSLTVHTLPVALFSNGHVAFVQRTPWRLGTVPIAIHATFQRFQGPGKRARLREFGLWHVDPPAYYGSLREEEEGPALARRASDGQFGFRALAYDDGGEVLAFVAELEAARYGGAGIGTGGRMPPFEKHWLGMSYQLAAFRDALAAARMLNRTLLLPRLWCWCDFDESPDVLETCRIKGSDLEQPFQCPLDYLLPLKDLDASGVDYRPPGFLTLPQVPVTVRKAKSLVVIAAERPDTPFPKPSATVGYAAQAWPGIKEGELLRAVEPLEGEAVLHLRGRVPGFLGGFDDPAAAAAFDALFRTAVTTFGDTPFWCCMSWGDADAGPMRKMPYRMPPPLAEGWQPWQPPKLEAPDWCDRVSSQHNNDKWARLPNHPCAFLRNATAAAAAVAAEAAGDAAQHAFGASADTNMAKFVGGG